VTDDLISERTVARAIALRFREEPGDLSHLSQEGTLTKAQASERIVQAVRERKAQRAAAAPPAADDGEEEEQSMSVVAESPAPIVETSTPVAESPASAPDEPVTPAPEPSTWAAPEGFEYLVDAELAALEAEQLVAVDQEQARLEAERADLRETALDYESMRPAEREAYRSRYVAAHGIRGWRTHHAAMTAALDEGEPNVLAMSPSERDAYVRLVGPMKYSDAVMRQLRRGR
jgi:hypothetical protein